MEFLIVGDPHIRQEDVGTVGKPLVEMLCDLGGEHRRLVLLGDLFHTHALVNLYVASFWREAIQRLSSVFEQVIILLGNHDAPHDMPAGVNALCEFKKAAPNVVVVDCPTVSAEHFLFLPFYRENADFEAALQAHPQKVVFCHQEFNGSKFENGFFSKGGVDPDVVADRDLVIGGHLHMEQEFANIWYPGSPRWLTLSDANQVRSVWLTEWNEGKMVSRQRIPTAGVLPRVVSVEDDQEHPVDPKTLSVFSTDQVTIVIKGEPAWVESRLPLWAGIGRVKTVPVQARAASFVSEAEGVVPALQRYLEVVSTKDGVPGDRVFAEISRRVAAKGPIFAQ